MRRGRRSPRGSQGSQGRAAATRDRTQRTTAEHDVCEIPPYPRWAFPAGALADATLVDDGATDDTPLGKAARHSLRVDHISLAGAAHVLGDDAPAGLAGAVTLEWDTVDAWFEEDEEVFVHPRSPYARVDAVRSGRTVRVELDGALLAESSSPVMVFETGLPTRYYLDRTSVHWTRLVPSETVSQCPHKGRTTGYWSVRTGDGSGDDVTPDLAWAYDFPTRQLLPIAGLVAFYNEHVDISIDGERQPRPTSPF